MKNFKHSLIAVIAVAMISSLAVAQASGLNNSKTEREQRINAAAWLIISIFFISRSKSRIRLHFVQ